MRICLLFLVYLTLLCVRPWKQADKGTDVLLEAVLFVSFQTHWLACH